jgi:KRAB domain-containing zinc finger protein
LKHLSFIHPNHETFCCYECDAKFTNRTQLLTHNYVHDLPKLRCNWNECQFETTSKTTYATHYATHTGTKPYVCDWPGCELAYNSSRSLNSHIDSKHLVKTIECSVKCQWPECERSFRTANELKSHERSHTGEKPYVCDWPECGVKLGSIGSLNKHIECHKGIKRFSCDWNQCQKKFASNSDLKYHLECHRKGAVMRCKCCQTNPNRKKRKR